MQWRGDTLTTASSVTKQSDQVFFQKDNANRQGSGFCTKSRALDKEKTIGGASSQLLGQVFALRPAKSACSFHDAQAPSASERKTLLVTLTSAQDRGPASNASRAIRWGFSSTCTFDRLPNKARALAAMVTECDAAKRRRVSSIALFVHAPRPFSTQWDCTAESLYFQARKRSIGLLTQRRRFLLIVR